MCPRFKHTALLYLLSLEGGMTYNTINSILYLKSFLNSLISDIFVYFKFKVCTKLIFSNKKFTLRQISSLTKHNNKNRCKYLRVKIYMKI